MSRSARAGSASPPTSWAASSWSSAATADSPAGVPVGVLVEWVFEFMAGTYQPHSNASTNPDLGTNFLDGGSDPMRAPAG
jgi:hypothetical protein